MIQKFMILFFISFSHCDHICLSIGYYPDSDGSCTTFYRCTDIWGDGNLQTFQFMCSPGTVFDPVYNVCNWPAAVPNCGLNPAPDSVMSTTENVYSEHKCRKPGIFKHEDDCQKFWLCKEQKTSRKLKVCVEVKLLCPNLVQLGVSS